MTFNFDIPIIGGTQLQMSLDVGQILFLLGANGTGKSGLMHRLFTKAASDAHWISAHRPNWFPRGAISLSGEQRRQTGLNISGTDLQAESRWTDHYAAQRVGIAVYDLIDAENVRARRIADAADMQDFELVKVLTKVDAPIKVIN